ncbi:MAG: tRNA (N6-isopentenyl adenosine(37)-C2)-methylthiotransferase MiaB [Planctomycetes bacterium]|nr:tRNA (N6-isopentenyl adenosine(37)-C2)-methylthiotransferase MiaB [Planctomycetota bacterium]
MTDPKYHLTSYGCQMNKLDSELVETKLQQRGYAPADAEQDADVVLINTCSVRQHAEDRVWSKLGKLRVRKRTEPQLVVGVLGCMAQEHKRYMLSRMPHVDLVVGPSSFGDIDETVERARSKNAQLAAERQPARTRHDVVGAGMLSVDQGVSGDRITRNVKVRPHQSQAYMSIMRGCNMPCSYCIVPTTRGDEVSRPIADLVDEANRLCDDGVTEITLLGQTVNAYGRDLKGQDANLSRLLRALHEIPSLRRLAFITSHPNFLSPDLIDAIAELPKVSRYLHLPAQSGSNRVLKAMRRGYTVERYRKRIEQLRAKAPDIELHSDWIVGYPGETAEDFEQTVQFCRDIGFAQSYVFKYSPRPGTLSSDLEDDVPTAEKERRNQVLLAVQEELSIAKNRALVGQTVEVLVEGESKVKGRLTGRTAHHRLVHFDSADASLFGQYVPVRVTEALAHSCVGELLPHDAAEEGAHDRAEGERLGVDR